jgi:hypothetical protein
LALVFVSYRRDDTAVVTDRLAGALRREYGEDQVFYDRGVDPGVRFPDRIRKAIAEAEVLLVVVGSRFAGQDVEGESRLTSPDDWVRQELEMGLESGVLLIPILVDGSRWEDLIEMLPDSLRSLPKLQSLQLSTGYGFEHEFNEIKRSLNDLLDERSLHRLPRGTLTEIHSLDDLERRRLEQRWRHRLESGENRAVLHHRFGLCLLYPPPDWKEARDHLEKARDLEGTSSTIAYYLALSMLDGQRPRRLRMRTARQAVALLDAMDGDGLPAQFHALAWLIKLDYFSSRGLAGSAGRAAASHLEAYQAASGDSFDLEYLLSSLEGLPDHYFAELGFSSRPQSLTRGEVP